MTKTIAILGAGSTTGAAIAHELAGAGYVLLLMDKQTERCELLRQALLNNHPFAVIELATCAYESAWEADIIVLALSKQAQAASAQVIRDVVTGKRVIRVTDCPDERPVPVDFDTEPLTDILPHTRIVDASLADFQQHTTALLT